MRDISNSADVFDSRDVDARIEELTDLIDAAYVADGEDNWDDERAELVLLTKLREDADCSEWKHGLTLIRDSYFRTYAEEMAEDIGAIPKDASWPACHIDWEAATEALQQDYTSVEYDGVTYWHCCC